MPNKPTGFNSGGFNDEPFDGDAPQQPAGTPGSGGFDVGGFDTEPFNDGLSAQPIPPSNGTFAGLSASATAYYYRPGTAAGTFAGLSASAVVVLFSLPPPPNSGARVSTGARRS